VVLFIKHTHNTQLIYGSVDFVWDKRGEPVPEETFTHSLIVVINHPYLLSPSTTIHGILVIVDILCLRNNLTAIILVDRC